jgi:hypothetical protein
MPVLKVPLVVPPVDHDVAIPMPFSVVPPAVHDAPFDANCNTAA